MEKVVEVVPRFLRERADIPPRCSGWIVGRPSQDPEHGNKEWLYIDRRKNLVGWTRDQNDATVLPPTAASVAESLAYALGHGCRHFVLVDENQTEQEDTHTLQIQSVEENPRLPYKEN